MTEAVKETFLGLSSDGWIAVGTVGLFLATAVLAAVTVFLVLAAREEIREVREEARKNRTLEIIGKYDHDPVLDRSLRRMARARDTGRLESHPRDYRLDIVAVLNYLETLAIGIKQGLYIEALLQDFMEPIIKEHITEVIEKKLLEKIDSNPEDFEHIFVLNKKWESAKPPPKTHYTGG